jgi:hypothetical protein
MSIGFTATAARVISDSNAKNVDVSKELTYIFSQIAQATVKGLYNTNITIEDYHAILTSPKTEKIVQQLKELGYKIPFLRCGPTLDMKVSWNED